MKKFIILIVFAIMLTSAQAVCNDCTLKITPVSNNLCQGDSAVYDIEITNAYSTTKEFTLSVDSDIPLSSNLTSKIVVPPYGKRKIRVGFRPLQYVLGQHQMSIKVSGYGAEDVDYALFEINDCYKGSLEVENSAVLCRNTQGRVDFTVLNNGSKTDTYHLSVEGVPTGFNVNLPQNQVTLAPRASQKLSALLDAGNLDYGIYNMYVTINSQDAPITKKIQATVMDCHTPSIQVQNLYESCPLAGRSYYITIKNDRPLTNNYYLSLSGTCDASLQTRYLELGSGESAQVAVNLGSRTGECDVTVKAENEYISVSKTTHVIMSKCYNVNLEIIPPVWTVCNGEDVKYDLKVTNKGYYPDSYDLNLIGLNKKIANDHMYLSPGQSETTYFEVANTWCTTDDIPFTVTAVGQASDSESGRFSIIDDPVYCSDLSLKPAKNTYKLECGLDAYSVLVKNSGYEEQKVMVYADSPIGQLVQPNQISLKPTETREVALYPMPEPGFVGNFSIEVIAKGEHKSTSMTFYASVSGDECVLSVFPPQKNEDDSNVTIIIPKVSLDEENETLEQNQSMSPTGAATSPNSNWDISIIALLICVLALAVILLLGWSKNGTKNDGNYFPEVNTQQELDAKRREAIKEAITKTSR